MVECFQILTIIGIVLEFGSVLIISYKTFHPWKTKDRKAKRFEKQGVGQPNRKKYSKDWLGIVSIILLALGLLFQIGAVLLPS